MIQKWLTLIMLQKNIKKHNQNWPQIPDHPYRIIIIIGGSGSGKTNSFNLISHKQLLIKFIYMLKIHMKQNIIFKWFKSFYWMLGWYP